MVTEVVILQGVRHVAQPGSDEWQGWTRCGANWVTFTRPRRLRAGVPDCMACVARGST